MALPLNEHFHCLPQELVAYNAKLGFQFEILQAF